MKEAWIVETWAGPWFTRLHPKLDSIVSMLCALRLGSWPFCVSVILVLGRDGQLLSLTVVTIK